MLDDMADLSAGLQRFGLSEYESRVYLALLSNGPSTVNQLQHYSGVPRTKIYATSLRLKKNGLVTELEGRPVRFQCVAPDIFQSAISEGEKRVKVLKRVFTSLKKVGERNMLPHDLVEERYFSMGSQSLLMKLKESSLKAQQSVRCIVDEWGLHLLHECSEELETISRQDVEVRIVSSVPSTPPGLQFSSSKMVVRYGRHLTGKSVFVFDNLEMIIVNSQTGRGFSFLLNELRDIARELFDGFWRTSANGKTLLSISSLAGDLPALLDTQYMSRLFIESVARSITDDKIVSKIGSEFLSLIRERLAPRVTQEPFENIIKIITVLMEQELGEEASIDYDSLTRILRLEVPEGLGSVPNSVWYFALVGLLNSADVRSEILQNTVYPEAKSRVIQAKISVAQR